MGLGYIDSVRFPWNKLMGKKKLQPKHKQIPTVKLSEAYDLFTKGKAKDVDDKRVQAYLNKQIRLHSDDFKIFDLWVEYLKRSQIYKDTCDWFKIATKKHPLPPNLPHHKKKDIRGYLIFIKGYDVVRKNTPLVPLKELLPFIQGCHDGIKIFCDVLSPTIFPWAIEAGFANDFHIENGTQYDFNIEILVNFFVFGNLHQNSKEINRLRCLQLIENRKSLFALKIADVIDVFFEHANKGGSSSLEEFTAKVKLFFQSDLFLSIALMNPYENKEKCLKAVSELIDRQRERFIKVGIKNDEFKFLMPDQFEWPSGKIRFDELERYLMIFDLKNNGKSAKQIGHEIYSSYDSESAKRLVFRDIRKAKNIIKNVEQGYFPGKYK